MRSSSALTVKPLELAGCISTLKYLSPDHFYTPRPSTLSYHIQTLCKDEIWVYVMPFHLLDSSRESFSTCVEGESGHTAGQIDGVC